MSLLIRAAAPSDFAALAEFRWEWMTEFGNEATVSKDEFVAFYESWALENQSTHSATVAIVDGSIVGMAWLAIVPRVPTPRSLKRSSGDIQSVYVTPHLRNQGIGAEMIAELVRRAREAGIERMTVHSSVRGVGVYTRNGFVPESELLQLMLDPRRVQPVVE